MKGEFTSMKLRRVTMRWFSSHKGRIMAERKHRMSDDEALFEILGRLERTEKSFAGAARVEDLFCFIKAGKPYNSAKEIDKVVYGL